MDNVPSLCPTEAIVSSYDEGTNFRFSEAGVNLSGLTVKYGSRVCHLPLEEKVWDSE